MTPYRKIYLRIFKIGMYLLLTIGCNLSIEGHFWPNNIFPYVSFALNLFLVEITDWHKLLERLRQNKNLAYMILLWLFSIFMQGMILRIYMADSFTVLIKAGIKVVIAGTATAVILMSAVFKMREEKQINGISFIIFSLLELIYFYFIRQVAEGFSLYPVLLLLLLYIAARSGKFKAEMIDRAAIITKAGAVIPALFETLGYLALTYWNYHGGLFKWLALAAVGTVVWSFIFYYVLMVLFVMLDGISEAMYTGKAVNKDMALGKYSNAPKTVINRSKLENMTRVSDNKKIAAAAFIMITLRCLYWFNWFPALLSKDTYVQIQQALGNEPYSNHHPWLHTMIIKFFMNVGKAVFGSNQAGVALTAFASLLVSSFILLWILRHYCDKVPSGVWMSAALIFMIEPIHCVYSITIWKDVMFAYALAAFCFMLIFMEGEIKKSGRLKAYIWALYIALTFIFCFSRTNGLYAWLFTLPFLLWHYRRNLKPWIAASIICLLLIIGYKGWLLPHFQVTEPDTVESLSVPLQQVAFAIRNEGEFSEYDKSVINNIVDMEAMGERYNAHISDPVKNLIRNSGSQEYIAQNKLDFIKMYISVGVKNPLDYIVAFLNQSRGYWYQKMSNYIYFSEGVHRFAAELDIVRTPLFPAGASAMADALMNKYCDAWHTVWSLALSTYSVWILFVYSWGKKRTCFYFLPVIGVFITLVIATPVNDEFRYAYGIYLTLPLLFMQTVSQGEAAEE